MNDLLRLAGEFRNSLRHAVYLSRSLDEGGELSNMQLSTLNMAAEAPHRVSAVARKLGVRVPSATEQIIKLETAGLLARQSDPEDSRAVHIALTDAGHDALEAANAKRNRQMAELLGALTDSERHTLAAALPVIEQLNTTALESSAL